MISSVNAYLPDPLVMDYSAAKAALSNWAKSLSKHLGPRQIRVNTVRPGPVATDLWLGDRKSDRERQQNPDQGLDDDHPNGKRNPPLTRPQHPPHGQRYRADGQRTTCDHVIRCLCQVLRPLPLC